jgi:hypothetical protein
MIGQRPVIIVIFSVVLMLSSCAQAPSITTPGTNLPPGKEQAQATVTPTPETNSLQGEEQGQATPTPEMKLPEGDEQATSQGWETHTYKKEELGGFALSFATPAQWLATGPIGERQIGGWYDPSYPKPPDPGAVWCYWMTCTPPAPGVAPWEDPIVITDTQKKIATGLIQGDWSYHLMCVAPVDLFDKEEPVFDEIMKSLEPLPLGTG